VAAQSPGVQTLFGRPSLLPSSERVSVRCCCCLVGGWGVGVAGRVAATEGRPRAYQFRAGLSRWAPSARCWASSCRAAPARPPAHDARTGSPTAPPSSLSWRWSSTPCFSQRPAASDSPIDGPGQPPPAPLCTCWGTALCASPTIGQVLAKARPPLLPSALHVRASVAPGSVPVCACRRWSVPVWGCHRTGRCLLWVCRGQVLAKADPIRRQVLRVKGTSQGAGWRRPCSRGHAGGSGQAPRDCFADVEDACWGMAPQVAPSAGGGTGGGGCTGVCRGWLPRMRTSRSPSSDM